MDTFAERSHRSLKLRTLALVVAILGTFAAFGAASASADFGVESFDVTFANQDGTPATQAGSHPFEAVESFGMNTRPDPTYGVLPEEPTRDVTIDQVPGVVGDSRPTPTCSTLDLITIDTSLRNACPNDSAVGYVNVHLALFGALNLTESVYNLETTPGVPARLGFTVLPVPITVNVGVNEGGSHNLVASLRNTSQALNFLGAETILWGVPSDSAHDPYRGRCLELFALPGEAFSNGSCPVTLPPKPFLTLPTSCSGPQESSIEADSWFHPGVLSRKTALTHDFASPPNPQGFTGCGRLGFAPSIETRTTSDSAETGTGLDFSLNFEDEGLVSTTGLSQSTAKKAEVTLPEGVTINPSIGEGLGVCTPQEIERETATTAPGEGCPNASKIGTLEVQTPLLPEAVGGSVFLAEQDNPETTEPGAENPFDSLIALYLVVKSTDLGINVKLPMKVEPDPKTGRLVASVEDIPQIPFSHFNFHFKEGVRAAMVTPPTCGSYTTEGKFWPWSDPTNPRTVTSSFEITKGVGGGPCPPGGIPPFDPHFEAGAVNNNAGSFSPFDMRITREDGEQDMTKFSAVLPPGELGSLAGVSKCPDSAIATAKGKTGRQELASPSCPANSLIGHTLAGAGVGSALTYVGGQIYLGGPYHGDPLSVIAITPAVAGPFDAGTIVVQEALTLNPKTAEVEVDGAHSDPIPHIVKGIVLKLRDLRVNVDRPNFTLNPTSCDESKARSVLFGSYINVLDPSDDRPVDLSTRYQAANCLNLGFKPRLALSLKGGTKRGGHPGLKAVYSPRKGDANIKGLVVRLPRSAFLDQAHIKTICTRVQFAAGGGNGEQCPAASRYGFVKAWTPLLDEPLEGPVFLRSSNHKLPDLLFALHGLVDIEVDVRIDSSHGGIRATLEDAPDATLSKVVLHMQGAKKGLIINSKNLCGSKNRANVLATGHNGKQSSSKPVMRAAGCGGKRKHERHRH